MNFRQIKVRRPGRPGDPPMPTLPPLIDAETGDPIGDNVTDFRFDFAVNSLPTLTVTFVVRPTDWLDDTLAVPMPVWGET